MIPLLLFITVIPGADAWFLLTNFEGNYMEAKLSCSRAGGRLPLPGDDVGNIALAELLQANDVTSTWVDVELVETPWRINGAGIIYDQGCHGAGSLEDRLYYNPERWENCAPLCRSLEFPFAGYLISGSSATCVCLNYITPLRRLRDCRGRYYNGYRVVATSQSTRHPVANLPWTARSGSWGGMCSLTVTVVSGSNLDLRLEEDNCYNPHHALCCVQDTASMFPMYTWFDAHYKCSAIGGNIVTQRDSCGQGHTDPVDYSSTRFWSEVNAWVWYINDSFTSQHRFTNWSQEQPSLASGSCVVVTREGAWESAFCDEVRTVVCETVETTPTTPRSTSSQLTSLQTETISSQPTDSVTSGDVSTNQGQHAPGNKSGIAGIAAGTVVGALVVLALVGTVICVLVIGKRQTDRGSPTHLNNSVYSTDNDDVIISRTENGPNETTIRENSMYGWSGNNRRADSDPYFSESTTNTAGGTGSGGQSKPREVSSVHMTVVDNELYGESDTAQTSRNEPVYSLEQLCDGEGHDEASHNNDDEDDDDDDNDDDGDFESVNEAIKGRELQPHSQLSRHDSVV